MSFRAFDLLVAVLLLETAWLGWRWATHDPPAVHRRWSLFEASLGEQGPCWRSGYEVVCSFGAPPTWHRPGEAVPILVSSRGEP